MRQMYKTDENGFYTEPVIVGDNEIPERCVATKWETPIYKPKWNGTEWIEGLTQAEIDSLYTVAPEHEISTLKAELEQTDYKIIKCSEYQLAGQPLPYDIQALHTERQALRDQINEIELALS